MTKQEQVLQALTTKLTTDLPSVLVTRARVYPFEQVELPSASIESRGVVPSDSAVGAMDWDLSFDITFYIESSQPETDFDPIFSTLFNSLLSDRSLGGLAMDIEPGPIQYDRFQGEKEIGQAVVSFTIKFRTTTNDLTE